MKDDLRWKTTLDERRPLNEDNLWWTITFDGRQPLMEDDLWWKTTFDERHPLMEDTHYIYIRVSTVSQSSGKGPGQHFMDQTVMYCLTQANTSTCLKDYWIENELKQARWGFIFLPPSSSVGKQSQLLLKPTEVELGLKVGVEFDKKLKILLSPSWESLFKTKNAKFLNKRAWKL